MSVKRRTSLGLILSSVASLAFIPLVACNGGDDNVTPHTTVNVSLKQFSVTPAMAAASAGDVTFHVTNAGSVIHEFLVIDTDLAPDALPTNADGSYYENGPGTAVLGSVEDMDPGVVKDLTLNLKAGKYVLICNMVAGGVSHYASGMRTAFTVN